MGKNQNEILLRFHGNPFKFYKKRYAERSYCIKVTPFDLRHREVTFVLLHLNVHFSELYKLP